MGLGKGCQFTSTAIVKQYILRNIYTVVDIKKVFVFDRKLRFARGPRNSFIVVMIRQACSIWWLSLGDIAHSSYTLDSMMKIAFCLGVKL